jgi:hypothetical protein
MAPTLPRRLPLEEALRTEMAINMPNLFNRGESRLPQALHFLNKETREAADASTEALILRPRVLRRHMGGLNLSILSGSPRPCCPIPNLQTSSWNLRGDANAFGVPDLQDDHSCAERV